MGVDYRANVGYGFTIPDEDLETLAEKLGYPESEWGFDAWEFGNWLVEGTTLVAEHVGDLMNGHDIALMIVAASSHMEANMYYDAGIKYLGEPELTFDEGEDLRRLWQRVYPHGTQPLGWVLAMSIY